jgi:hypothetical protein
MAIFSAIPIALYPRSLDVFVPAKRREEGVRAYAPQVLCGLDDIRVLEGIEAGGDSLSSDSETKEKHDDTTAFEADGETKEAVIR